MRGGTYATLLFFVCLNLGFSIVNETQALPYYITPPETPTSIMGISLDRIITGGIILVVGTLISFALGHLLLGGTITIIIFALELLAPVIDWAVFGFPKFLSLIGVPDIISVSLKALFAFIFFWFLVGIVSQRYME